MKKYGKVWKKIKRLLCCLMIGLLLIEQTTVTARAAERAINVGDTFAEGDFFYSVDEANGTTGKVTCKEVTARAGLLEHITIPSTVKHDGVTYTVWRIGQRAISENHNVKTITIEQGVEEIGQEAIFYNHNLESITLPEEGLIKIEYQAFASNRNLKSINIPSGVKEIGEDVLADCNIENLVIPDDMVEIPDNAFRAAGLTTVTLPKDLTTIGKGALSGCDFENISIPAGVTTIGEYAFGGCYNLTSITIPSGVERIQFSTFQDCHSLKNVTLNEGLLKIETTAFAECKALQTITIPENVTEIGVEAFRNSGLTSVEIPKKVGRVASHAFQECTNLTEAKVWDTTRLEGAFYHCSSLATLKIVVTGDTPIPLQVSNPSDCFANCPGDRRIVFLAQDGTELTGDALLAAQDAYRAVSDGNTTDDLWYGWKLTDTAPDVYAVEIQVKKDGQLWEDSGKTFCLTKDGGNSYITDLTAVEDGTYDIYEVKESEGGTRERQFLDTGVDVTVNGADTEVAVDYYTVTFYDGDTPYGADTAQRPQIVCKNQKASQPADPAQTGFTFRAWVTEKDGSTDFNFAGTGIDNTTELYADWTADVVPGYPITASAGEGGSITPAGTVDVPQGGNCGFTITPEEGYEIESVLVDGRDEGAVESYTFTDVREAHSITVTFVKKDVPAKPDVPGGDDTVSGNEPDPGDDTASGNDPGPGNDPEPDEGTTGDNNPGPATETDNPGGGADNTAQEDEEPADTQEPVHTELSGSTDSAGRPAAEPKTGDTLHTESYATVAMIAGLSYLLLYFADENRGMTEEEKKEIVAGLVRWAKKGGKMRRYAALAAIFFVLVYYHSIGKRVEAKIFC